MLSGRRDDDISVVARAPLPTPNREDVSPSLQKNRWPRGGNLVDAIDVARENLIIRSAVIASRGETGRDRAAEERRRCLFFATISCVFITSSGGAANLYC